MPEFHQMRNFFKNVHLSCKSRNSPAEENFEDLLKILQLGILDFEPSVKSTPSKIKDVISKFILKKIFWSLNFHNFTFKYGIRKDDVIRKSVRISLEYDTSILNFVCDTLNDRFSVLEFLSTVKKSNFSTF